MEAVVQVAIISAAASVVVAMITSALTKRAERRDELHRNEIEHYRELLSSISELAIDGTDKDKANVRFAHAANTIALVAPQAVINALMDFHEEVRFSNPERSLKGHDAKLRRLLLEIRKSLKLPFSDVPESFHFHLIGSSHPREST